MAAANDGLFAALCDVLDRPELATDERFATNAARVQNRSELLPLLEETFRTRTSDDWLAALDAAGVPVGKIRGVLDALRTAAPATIRVDHSTAGELELVAPPLAFAGAAPAPPPLLGQHTREVLAELGVDDARLAALESADVVATAET